MSSVNPLREQQQQQKQQQQKSQTSSDGQNQHCRHLDEQPQQPQPHQQQQHRKCGIHVFKPPGNLETTITTSETSEASVNIAKLRVANDSEATAAASTYENNNNNNNNSGGREVINGEGKKKRSVDNVVEAYLDEHLDFLDDYVRRKVSRSQLEKWLFTPSSINRMVKPSRTRPHLSLNNSSLTPGDNTGTGSEEDSAKTGSLLSCVRGGQQHGQTRQRSRSFTPLRKVRKGIFFTIYFCDKKSAPCENV